LHSKVAPEYLGRGATYTNNSSTSEVLQGENKSLPDAQVSHALRQHCIAFERKKELCCKGKTRTGRKKFISCFTDSSVYSGVLIVLCCLLQSMEDLEN